MFYPQHETKEPKRGTSYYTPNPSGSISKYTWKGGDYDYARLTHANVYLKESDAKDRVRWNLETVCRSPTVLLERASELLDTQKKAGETASKLAAAAMSSMNVSSKEPTMSEFPQPEVVAPPKGATYFINDTIETIITCKWYGESWDHARLASHKVYLTPGAAQARFNWDIQEAKKRTIPVFIRELGSKENIEYNHAFTGWGFYDIDKVTDWSFATPDLFRAKPDWLTELGPEVEIQCGNGRWATYNPKDFSRDHNSLRNDGVLFRAKRKPVVKEINGVCFSWPATVQLGDPAGLRFAVRFSRDGGHSIVDLGVSKEFGCFVHETREGAIEQSRALTAMIQ